YNEPLLPADHPDAESEHTVVAIARAMADILVQQEFRVKLLGLARNPAVLWQELKKVKPAVVLNLFEGNPDNSATESYVAGLLEWSGIPYTGSPPPALSLARAKHTAKTLLRGAGLPTADFLVVQELPAPECTLGWPVIIKPAEQDASIGLDQDSVCTTQYQLDQRVAYILETYGAPVLIEQYIAGREFNVALVELPELQTLPPAEIEFKARPGAWPILTYAGKWKRGSEEYTSTPPKYPADITPRLAKKLGAIALKAYRLIGCRDYARVDFRVTADGKPYILEVNPNPEISDEAGFAGCLGSGHFPYREFIVRLIRHALARGSRPGPSVAVAPRNGAAQLAH
ncbi:MAG: D-alanine--D-alanine ligase, partial [Acidobacteria bacterium]|nr:D-alanine--D-alanine ligase [Acidobacteriota bacterium]